MQILGQGHNGIVVAGESGAVKKFYRAKPEYETEKFSLEFLAYMQECGFEPDYTIPQLISSTEGTWNIDGKAYSFCNHMQRVSGRPANSAVNQRNLEYFGEALGELLFNLHDYAKNFTAQFQKSVKIKHTLLGHILGDKFGKVKEDNSKENDEQIKEWAAEAAEYLETRLPQLADELTLSHPDLSLSNILIDENGGINGIVDWGYLGLMHPSLSLYQLVTNPNLWAHVKKQYESSGGVIREDIVYAASTIHLAWAPIICGELGEEPDEYETRARLQEVYEHFKQSKQ